MKNTNEDAGLGRLFATNVIGIGMLVFCIYNTAIGDRETAVFYLGGFIGVYTPIVFSFLIKSCLRAFKGGNLDD